MSKNKRLVADIIIKDKVVMSLDDNILFVDFGAQDRGNLTDVVNWGIYANRGSISFIDKIGYFDENTYSSDFKNATIKFYLAKSDSSQIASFNVDSFNFDEQTKQVDVELVGKIVELQKKPSSLYGRIAFPFYKSSASYLLGYGESLDADYNVLYPKYGISLGEDSTSIEKTMIYCPYLPSEKAWDRFTKICQATMCRIIEDENGNPIITGERPSRTPIVLIPSNIISISNPYFARVINPSIELTNRERHENKKLDQISKQFAVNYDSAGTPLSISNAEYSFGAWETDDATNEQYRYATISAFINSPYKIYRNNSTHRTSLLEVALIDGTKGQYHTESFESGFPVIGEYDKLRLNDSFVFVRKSSDRTTNVKNLDYSFFVDYFEDSERTEMTDMTDSSEDKKTIIESNDLIQTSSYFLNEDGNEQSLGEHILEQVKRRYSNGIECFELECLFNEYYDENGNLVFDGNDMSQHFKKYDLIIPYVNKNGETVPLRTNEDGTPKKFRIIGISYSYDGLLKQKLSVQEERYDVD